MEALKGLAPRPHPLAAKAVCLQAAAEALAERLAEEPAARAPHRALVLLAILYLDLASGACAERALAP